MRGLTVHELILCFCSLARQRFAWFVALIIATAAPAQTPAAKVVVSGGPDATGQRYLWTVANQYDSPVIGVELPHFRGGLFAVPEGWSGECTNQVGVGVPDEPGVCRAVADAARFGIAQPHTATFELQLAAKGAKQGAGAVRVRFADGSETVIDGVILPVRESPGEKFAPLIGLGAIGVLIVLLSGRRKRAGE